MLFQKKKFKYLKDKEPSQGIPQQYSSQIHNQGASAQVLFFDTGFESTAEKARNTQITWAIDLNP